MDLKETLKHFIQETEADLSEISWNINDEIDSHSLDPDPDEGWHQTQMQQLADDYDEKEMHLKNLKQLLKMFENKDQ